MVRDAIVGVLIPAAIALAGVLVAWRPWSREASPKRPDWGAALGVGAGFAAAYMLIDSRLTPIPPHLASDWIPTAALAGAIIAILLGTLKAPAFVSLPVRVLASIALPALVMAEIARPTWEGWLTPTLYAAGIGAVIFAQWQSLHRLSARVPGPVVPLSVVLAASASAGVMVLLALTARLAQGLGALAAATAAILILALWRRDLPLFRGAAGPLSLALAAVWLVAHYFSSGSNAIVAALCFLAPSAAWIGDVKPLRKRPPWLRAIIRLVAVLVVLGVGVGVAFAIAPPIDDYGGYDY